MATTLYYIVVNAGDTAPTGAQVVAGVSYAGATVLDAGSVAYTSAGTYDADSAPVTGASASTAYDQWWVAYDGVTYGTPVSGEITTDAAAQHESGGASSAVDVSAAGSGAAAESASGGASAVSSVTAAGAGTAAESASGGASATVTVTAAGEGTSSEDTAEHYSGGASATVAITSAGVGVASEHATGGSAAIIWVRAAGAGVSSEGGPQGKRKRARLPAQSDDELIIEIVTVLVAAGVI